MITSINEYILSKGYDFEPSLLNGRFQKLTDKLGHKVWYIGSDLGDGFFNVSFGDFRDPSVRHFWSSKASLTPVEIDKQKKFIKKTIEDKSIRQEITKEVVGNIVEQFKREDVGRNAGYLVGKKLPRPQGVIVRGDTDTNQDILVIPIVDGDGELWNIQTIYAGGAKTMHPGGRITGCFFTFQGTSDKILIGEGFATCLAAHLATGFTVVCAFNISNLESAVKQTLELGVKANDICLLADFDGATFLKTGKNPGMLAVQKLTRDTQVRWAAPILSGVENVDFADVEELEIRRARIVDSKLWSDLNGMVFSPPPKAKVKRVKVEAVVPPGPQVAIDNEVPQMEVMAMPIPFEEPLKLEVLSDKMEFPTKENGFFSRELKGKQMVDVPDFLGFSKWLAVQYNFKANDSFMYFYEDDHYRRVDRLELKNISMKLIKENTAPHLVTQFTEAARSFNYVSRDGLQEPAGYINLKNGILDVRNKKLLQHGPEFFFKYRLPHEYIEGAGCPQWIEFLLRTFEGNQELVDVCAEIFGYVLLGGEPFLHKAIVLSGEGRNGKSTLLDVLKYMLGPANFSSVPISKLGDQFSLVMADGKLANIVGETSMKEINSEAFKTAVSGEEVIASQKHLPEYSMPFNARIVLACNKLPHLGDATTGAYEKFFILPFNRYIKASERIPLYAKRMLFPEVSGVINWALDGLDRVILRGMLPEISAVSDQNIELREEIDSVFAWMREHVMLGSGPVQTVKVKNWYPNYKFWCEEQGRNTVSLLHFSKRIMSEVRKLPNFKITRPHNLVAITGPIEIDSSFNAGAGLPV